MNYQFCLQSKEQEGIKGNHKCSNRTRLDHCFNKDQLWCLLHLKWCSWLHLHLKCLWTHNSDLLDSSQVLPDLCHLSRWDSSRWYQTTMGWTIMHFDLQPRCQGQHLSLTIDRLQILPSQMDLCHHLSKDSDSSQCNSKGLDSSLHLSSKALDFRFLRLISNLKWDSRLPAWASILISDSDYSIHSLFIILLSSTN